MILIVLAGGALRFAGIGFGLPYTYVADEPSRWMVALHMVQTGDLDPHWLGYPHLAFYLNAIALFLYFVAGWLIGRFRTPMDIPVPKVITIGVGNLEMPSEFLVARGLTALFGTGAIILVYLIGCRLTNRKSVGLLSALAFAVSPAAVTNSQILSLDIYGLFFLLCAVYWILPISSDCHLRQYIMAGVGVGLAISGKYNVGIVAVTLVLAHFLRFGLGGFLRREVYVAGASVLLAFAIANPFSISDPGGFFYGLSLASDSQSQYSGTAESGLSWYLTYLWSVEGIAIALSIVQAVVMGWTRPRLAVIFLSFPVLYLVFISLFPVHNDRTILPVIPFIDMLAAWLLVSLYDWISSHLHMHRVRRLIWAVGCALLVLPPLQTSLAADLRSIQTDGRETARQWIDANLPVGSRIAEEGYTPFIDSTRFVVQGVTAITDHPPEWYVQNGFEYLVLSQGMYGRFFAIPDGYRSAIEKYNQFFDRFERVNLFDDNGYEIRIYRTGARLPTQRIGARFGDYDDLVELVGYEETHSRWYVGHPLAVTLFWRTLREKREPLEVVLHLTGEDGQEISHVQGDLFQGRGWQDGIFATEWTLPDPGKLHPGQYELRVNVVQTRYSYDTPAKAWYGDKTGVVILGPFKASPLPATAMELEASRIPTVNWSDRIAMVGYLKPSMQAHAGDTVPLTFYWKALSRSSIDYKLFVHLLDKDGRIVAQLDETPGTGRYPTSLWEDGETFGDYYALNLPEDIVPGDYSLEIGWYELSGNTRLPLIDVSQQVQGDRWTMLERIQVIP